MATKIKLIDLPAFLKKLFPDKPELGDLEFELPEPAKPAPVQTTPETAVTDPTITQLKQTVDTLLAENKKAMDALTEMKTRSDNQEKLLNDKAKTDLAAKIQTAIDTAVKEGRIPAKNEALIASYKKLLETDYDSTAATIAALPVIPANQQTQQNTQTQQQQQQSNQKKSGDPIHDTILNTATIVN